MLKQLKLYGLEKRTKLPDIDYSDWSSSVSVELAMNGFHFLNKLLLSRESLFRLNDILENLPEIREAKGFSFESRETREFVDGVYDTFSFSASLMGLSDMDDAEDLFVVSREKRSNVDYINVYILRRIMDLVLTEKEAVEVVSKELLAFDYKKLGNLALSEDKIYDMSHLNALKDEIKHALKHRFMSQKTMEFVEFLASVSGKKDQILTMDFMTVTV